MAESLMQSKGRSVERLSDAALLDAEAKYNVIVRSFMDQWRVRPERLCGVNDNRQLFIFDRDRVAGVFRLGAVLGNQDRHRLANVVNLAPSQSRRPRPLQHGLNSLQPTSRVDLETFRKRRYPAFDLPPGPHANDSIETKRIFNIDSADARVRVNATDKSGVEHIWQADIAHIQAVAGKEAARFFGFYTTANESRRNFRHDVLYLVLI
jgi:hypothetical protein